MNRAVAKYGVPALVGVLAVVAAIWLAVTDPATVEWDGPTALGGLAIVAGLVLALAKLRADPGDDAAAAPWTESGALVDRAPESTPDDVPVSGVALADHIETATRRAREGETVEAALASVRRPLRDALIPALVAGGRERDEALAALSGGTWTDDPVAAAVLDEQVLPPPQSLRRRLWTWLFPEAAIRRRTARAAGAVAAAADEALPPVVGQGAPRPAPVAVPGLADLRRAADGSLQHAEGAFTDGRPPGIDPGDADADRPGEAGNPGSNSQHETPDRGAGDVTDPATGGDWDDVGVSD